MRRQAINRSSSSYKILYPDNLNSGITQEDKSKQIWPCSTFPKCFVYSQVSSQTVLFGVCCRYITNSSPKGSQAAYLNASMKFSKRIQEDKPTITCILHTYRKSKGKSVLVLQTSQSWFLYLAEEQKDNTDFSYIMSLLVLPASHKPAKIAGLVISEHCFFYL